MRRPLRLSTYTLFFILLLGCTSLPEVVHHTDNATSPIENSALFELADSLKRSPTELANSAILMQETGWDALSQRLALVEAAEHSIDIQYYIWNSDQSGRYLASRLIAAADRGVQVRVMLDDINLNEREQLLVALDSHPYIEIRVFNPTPSRSGVAKWLNFLGDFSRLNRRMHNKSFTVDGAYSIVGGRNIGDEYFDLSDEINFRDRDVLVLGSVVSDIQGSFAEYWHSQWSYPVELLGGEVSPERIAFEAAVVPKYKQYPSLPMSAFESLRLLDNHMSHMVWVDARYISDRPVPADENNSDEPKLTARTLSQLARESEREVLLESAYLIFDDHQLDDWKVLESRGVKVKALTNSMASNDLVTNHSGYAGRRQEMLNHGVELFELKPETRLCNASTRDIAKCAPSTAYGLHAKSAVYDRSTAVIGSFNFNLRSTYLNTESILVINNPVVSRNLAENIERAMDEENSWRLDLYDNEVHWYSGSDVWDDEPETDHWQRLKSRLLQLLPIEKYL